MGISALVNWFVSQRLMKVAKQSDSIALESDASRCGRRLSFPGCIHRAHSYPLTGITLLDPLIAIGVALVIMKAAYDLTRRSLSDLIDHSIPQEMSGG